MNSTEANHQREHGAKMIAARAQELAEYRGMIIPPPEWDDGAPLTDRPLHTLRIVAPHDTIEGEFPDEALKDYPGRVGTEVTNATLNTMIDHLNASKPRR